MIIRRYTLDDCERATGTVVVIDVIRAFTTAAFAFARGASRIYLVGEVSEAFALRRRLPGSYVMGEVDGLKVEGFDFGNSPSNLMDEDLTGRIFVQRTSAGTQGVVRSTRAADLLGCSFVCVGATVRYLKKRFPAEVSLVVTGVAPGRDGDEDVACADYLEHCLLAGSAPDPAPYLQRVRQSAAGKILADPTRTAFPVEDLTCVTQLDRFDYALRVFRRGGFCILRPSIQNGAIPGSVP